MDSPYARILRERGAKTFVVTGIISRFDLSMAPLGIILMVNGYDKSLARATMLTGAFALSGAICAPQMSGLTDRRGQHSLLLALGATYLIAVLGLIATVLLGAPFWSSICFGLLAGGTNPMVPSMVRARWSALFHGTPSLRTAFAMESMIDAAIIALGAPLATFLAISVFPAATLLVAALAATASAFLLAVQRRTEPPISTSEINRIHNSTLIPRNLPPILVVLFFVGVHLGSFDVATIAVALDSGQPQWGGWILAAYAVGSSAGGAVVGRLKESFTTERLLYVVLALLSITVLPLMFVHDTMLRLVFGLTAGLAVAPTIILAMTLVETLTSPRRLTEALGWVGSALATGIAAGQILAGHAAGWQNGYAGYAVTLAGAAFGLITQLTAASGPHPPPRN